LPKVRFLRFLPRWLLFIAWGFLISWLSLTPTPPRIEHYLFGWDKFQHVVAYGVFTLLAGWAFGCFPVEDRRRWLRAVIAAVIFGGLIEIAQGMFTKTRTADIGDLLADTVGAVFAYWIFRVFRGVRVRIASST